MGAPLFCMSKLNFRGILSSLRPNYRRWMPASILTLDPIFQLMGVLEAEHFDCCRGFAYRAKKSLLTNVQGLQGRPRGWRPWKLQVFLDFRKVLLKKFYCISHCLGCADVGHSLGQTRGCPLITFKQPGQYASNFVHGFSFRCSFRIWVWI